MLNVDVGNHNSLQQSVQQFEIDLFRSLSSRGNRRVKRGREGEEKCEGPAHLPAEPRLPWLREQSLSPGGG